jgi:hypothetical protein
MRRSNEGKLVARDKPARDLARFMVASLGIPEYLGIGSQKVEHTSCLGLGDS